MKLRKLSASAGNWPAFQKSFAKASLYNLKKGLLPYTAKMIPKRANNKLVYTSQRCQKMNLEPGEEFASGAATKEDAL